MVLSFIRNQTGTWTARYDGIIFKATHSIYGWMLKVEIDGITATEENAIEDSTLLIKKIRGLLKDYAPGTNPTKISWRG